MATSTESANSRFLEKLREYVFLSEILQEAWLRRNLTVDVLRPDVDNAGYDLVLQCGKDCRYIQLRSSKRGARTGQQTLNVNLAQKLGGCVIWMFETGSSDSVDLEYRFLGGGPNDFPNLGDKTGKSTKANANGVKSERINTRTVKKNEFDEPVDIAGLFDKLFPQ